MTVPINLSLPIHCECGRDFKIDPVGVQPWTDIACPNCGLISHLDQETVDRVVDEYSDAIGELFEDEETYQRYMSLVIDAPDRTNAVILPV